MQQMIDLQNKIIETAIKYEADIVGFGDISRFDDNRIQEIFPKTKTVICMAFRVLRGVFRGIEEGTTYYQYSTNGVEVMEETVMPRALLRVSAVLEDAGFCAYPQRKLQCCMTEADGHNYEVHYEEIYHGRHSEISLDFPKTAQLCGIGEIGLDGTLLTDRFGPMQRYCFILTDVELPSTPLTPRHLCDNCGKCIHACPGHALDADGNRDEWQCGAYYRGANRTKNPFMPAEAFPDFTDREKIMSGTADLDAELSKRVMRECIFYPPIKQGYASSICGKACDIACYIHLEEQGKLLCSQKNRFRRRPDWKLSLKDG